MNIAVDSNIVFLKKTLEFDFNVISFDGGELNSDFLIENKIEILFVRSTTDCNETLLNNTKVKFVGTATAGIDNLDLDYLESNNIKWTNAAGSNSISVAEFVTLSIQSWLIVNLFDITNMKIGIIGFGNIGKKVGKIFEKYSKSILVSDPFVKDVSIKNTQIRNLEEVLSESDIITFHVPLIKNGNHPTFNILGSHNIDLVKKTTLIVNTSRGGVIDENSLLQNISSKNLIFDVWENEPNIDTEFASKLFLSTPHIAGHSFEGKLRGTLMMIEQLENYLGVNIDKSEIMKEMNKSTKKELSKLSFFELYNRLKNNLQLSETNNQFKRILENFDSGKFNNLRKNYPKHNETLSENSF